MSDPVSVPGNGSARESWQDIATAPRDGSHILVTIDGRSTTVVHWFEEGWHLSVNRLADHSEYVWGRPTHWMPVPKAPDRWFRVGSCESCGGRVESRGGMTEEGERWGGNCLSCGRGYGENDDIPPVEPPRPETRDPLTCKHGRMVCEPCIAESLETAAETRDGETPEWKLTVARSALENWGQHHPWCASKAGALDPCNCGLAKAIADATPVCNTNGVNVANVPAAALSTIEGGPDDVQREIDFLDGVLSDLREPLTLEDVRRVRSCWTKQYNDLQRSRVAVSRSKERAPDWNPPREQADCSYCRSPMTGDDNGGVYGYEHLHAGCFNEIHAAKLVAPRSASASSREASGETRPSDPDWHEDAAHENGLYTNRCVTCEREFMGHKRRVTCRACATPSTPVLDEGERTNG